MTTTPNSNQAADRRYLSAVTDGDLDEFDERVTPYFMNDNSDRSWQSTWAVGTSGRSCSTRERARDRRFEEVQLIAEGDLVGAHVMVLGEVLVHVVQLPPPAVELGERLRGDRLTEGHAGLVNEGPGHGQTALQPSW